MSLFGAMMGDPDDDPFFGGHMRRMNTMMNSFFRDPFGDMLGRNLGSELMPFAGNVRDSRGRELARYDQNEFGMGMGLMPMGFPNIRTMFSDMRSNPNCHSFSSSTVMTMTSGPDGRPQIYQASQSVKQGPGGVRETKKTVADSRTGVKKMAIGHHINDRAHIMEREQNVFSGEQEEREDFINLEEDEAANFNKEWEEKTRSYRRGNAIEYGKNGRRRGNRGSPQLALPSSQSHHHSRYNARSSCKPSHRYTLTSSAPNCHVLVSSDSEEDKEESPKKRKLDSEEQHSENEQPKPKNSKNLEKSSPGTSDKKVSK